MATAATNKIFEMFKDMKKPEEQESLPKQASKPKQVVEQLGIRKRTFEINEEVWSDFALMVKADERTFNDYINELIKREVIANADFIQNLKARKNRTT